MWNLQRESNRNFTYISGCEQGEEGDEEEEGRRRRGPTAGGAALVGAGGEGDRVAEAGAARAEHGARGRVAARRLLHQLGQVGHAAQVQVARPLGHAPVAAPEAVPEDVVVAAADVRVAAAR